MSAIDTHTYCGICVVGKTIWSNCACGWENCFRMTKKNKGFEHEYGKSLHRAHLRSLVSEAVGVKERYF
jgi:hypothetical protein